jgi:predicted ArsR family transcriptional regulator
MVKDKKLAVFNALQPESDPIGLNELLVKLGSEFHERSVRRWLSELVKEGVVEKQGQKRGTLNRAIGESPSYFRTCEQYSATIEALGFDRIRVIYRKQRREMLRHIILHALTGDSLQAYIQAQTQHLGQRSGQCTKRERLFSLVENNRQ